MTKISKSRQEIGETPDGSGNMGTAQFIHLAILCIRSVSQAYYKVVTTQA